MYESYYGLQHKPFSMLPDPGFLYLSRKHETALTLLEYALMSSAGFCVISGEPGAGKTTLLRKLLESVGDDVAVGMITNTHKSFGELLDWVLSAFSIHEPGLNKVEKNQKFIDYLLAQYAAGRSALLIVDEAQNMGVETLEELRMLSNINSDKDQLLQIILSGQPRLKEILRQPELMQFAQRIAVDYHLDSLSLQETCGYIQHRLKVAGATRDVFTPGACERVYHYSGGTPRLINLICDTALVYGYADQDETLNESIIEEMVRERMRDSVVPLFREIKAVPVPDEPERMDDIEFPWISPQGGTHGLKPDAGPDVDAANPAPDTAMAEKKTSIEADTTAQSQASAASVSDDVQAVTAARDASDAGVMDAAAPAHADTSAPGPQAAAVPAPESEPDPQPGSEPPAAVTAPAAGAQPDHADAAAHSATAAADDAYTRTRRLQPYRRSERRWRWLLAGVAAAGLAVVAVVLSIDSSDQQARRQMQDELRQQQSISSELSGELDKLRRQQERSEAALKRQAERLERERDEALARAAQEAELRAERERQVEQVMQQIAKSEARLQQESESRVKQVKARQQQIARDKADLEAELKAQRRRLAELVEELESNKVRAQPVAAAPSRQPDLEAGEPAAADSVESVADNKPREFAADPCTGPQAKFLSNCP